VHLPTLAAAAAALALGACQSAAPGPQARDYTLVWLKSGPKQQLSADEQRTVFAGHFANMERLAREGHLLLAGPFGKERGDTSLRGIFVLDTDSAEMARAWAESDPGFQAGVFRMEYAPLRTDAPLRALLRVEIEQQDAIKATGRTPAPGENGRGFALLFGDEGEAVERELSGHPAVLLVGRLGGEKGFAVVDAADGKAAAAALGAALVRIGPHRLEPWFASRNLERLPQL
jgi:uncharacterized protein YciI